MSDRDTQAPPRVATTPQLRLPRFELGAWAQPRPRTITPPPTKFAAAPAALAPPPAPAPAPSLLAIPGRVALGAVTQGIDAHDLVKRYTPGGPAIVDGISIQVAPGEIYGFLGPNGAGKSTTVNMLVTLLPASSGRITVAGFDVASQADRVRSSIGAALQAVSLDPMLTAREHLDLVGGLHGMSRTEARRRGDELLERIGLASAADKRTGRFSGGMKRRLDLVLALIHSPRVLFLDEPTTGLDPQSRTALWDEVRRLAWEDGVAVFLTTQYLEEADLLADRIGILNGGAIAAEGSPAQLKSSIGAPSIEAIPRDPADAERLQAVLNGFGAAAPARQAGAAAIRLPAGEQDAAAPLVAIVRAIDEAGVAVQEVRQHDPSLDDVFLAQTGRSLEGSRPS